MEERKLSSDTNVELIEPKAMEQSAARLLEEALDMLRGGSGNVTQRFTLARQMSTRNSVAAHTSQAQVPKRPPVILSFMLYFTQSKKSVILKPYITNKLAITSLLWQVRQPMDIVSYVRLRTY
jgi:hypothetical protein